MKTARRYLLTASMLMVFLVVVSLAVNGYPTEEGHVKAHVGVLIAAWALSMGYELIYDFVNVWKEWGRYYEWNGKEDAASIAGEDAQRRQVLDEGE